MKLTINSNTRLNTIQEEFNKHYPYLHLLFFYPSKDGLSKKNMVMHTQIPMGELAKYYRSDAISINGQQKVSTLEQQFLDNFGVAVQVFRKSGISWLRTTTTDNWTLAEQNRKGEEMNKKVEAQVVADYEQYHEQL